MVLPDSNRVSRAPSYSRKQTLSQRRFRVHGFHVLWLAIQTILLATSFSYLIEKVLAPHRKWDDSFFTTSRLTWSFVNSQHRAFIRLTAYPSYDGRKQGLGWSRFARHYSENRYLLSFPRPTKMFQFRRFPFNYPIYSGNDAHDMTHGGFPHSEISGYIACWQLPEAYRSLPRPSSVIYV